MKLKFVIILILALFPKIVFAETIHLMDIPLDDGTDFSYVVNVQENCSFKNVLKVETPKLDETPTTIMEKLGRLQWKINLAVEKEQIAPNLISFSVKAATNIDFEFSFDQTNCELIKMLTIDKKKYHVKSIEVDYKTPLQTPVLRELVVHTEERDIVLYPWALHGNIATYELEVGTGLEVHSNIRLNDQTAFHKKNPSFGPVGIFSFRYGPFFMNRLGTGSLLFNYRKLSILGIGLLEGENYKGENLKERKQGFFLGTLVILGFAEFIYYNDFLDQEKGLNLKLNLAPKFYYQTSWRFKPQFFAQYWSDKYVDYYYGVSPAESIASGLKTYKGSHTMNYGTTLEVMHFVGKWTFVTEFAAKFFGSEVYTSPTVTKKKELKITSGILYKIF